jgi:hypothetical protein
MVSFYDDQLVSVILEAHQLLCLGQQFVGCFVSFGLDKGQIVSMDFGADYRDQLVAIGAECNGVSSDNYLSSLSDN